MPFDPDRAQTPKSWANFTNALGRKLPKRLGELRAHGRAMRAIAGKHRKR